MTRQLGITTPQAKAISIPTATMSSLQLVTAPRHSRGLTSSRAANPVTKSLLEARLPSHSGSLHDQFP
eukprot:5228907-Amphidinium_carterae.1